MVDKESRTQGTRLSVMVAETQHYYGISRKCWAPFLDRLSKNIRLFCHNERLIDNTMSGHTRQTKFTP